MAPVGVSQTSLMTEATSLSPQKKSTPKETEKAGLTSVTRGSHVRGSCGERRNGLAEGNGKALEVRSASQSEVASQNLPLHLSVFCL